MVEHSPKILASEEKATSMIIVLGQFGKPASFMHNIPLPVRTGVIYTLIELYSLSFV